MGDNNLIKLIKEDYRRLAVQIISAMVTLIVAVLAIIYNCNLEAKVKSIIVIVSILCLVVSCILQIIMVCVDVNSDSHMVTYAKKIELKENLKFFKERLTKISGESRQLKCISMVVHTASVFLNNFYHSNCNGYENDQSFKDFLTAIIYEIFFTSMQSIFEKSSDEYFSVALYLYDSEHNLLWDFGVGAKDKQIHHKYSPGRVWHILDNGHVCYCYRSKEELIHDNIEEQIKAVKLGPRFPKPTDGRHYKSAITLPIFMNDNIVRGVFCITSNKANCFRTNLKNTDDTTTTEYNELDYILDTKINFLRILNEVIALSFNIFYGQNIPQIPQEVLNDPKNKKYLADISS